MVWDCQNCLYLDWTDEISEVNIINSSIVAASATYCIVTIHRTCLKTGAAVYIDVISHPTNNFFHQLSYLLSSIGFPSNWAYRRISGNVRKWGWIGAAVMKEKWNENLSASIWCLIAAVSFCNSYWQISIDIFWFNHLDRITKPVLFIFLGIFFRNSTTNLTRNSLHLKTSAWIHSCQLNISETSQLFNFWRFS